ncbi:hypothetical protein BABINDRAFT_162348 [Babjeviella inositovora NRRL Y-12698]|uniref:Uncharacterized protein n=1 Tax=Babjeviella inositovora NRRL Y-12698 TaxID=984486 RepID=A0A1E3QLV7_9ASCO|nr:uncharacterized protein BABINDRAFT_162348 [Babjeviella inositovora NRRL Y-12698]ODQ78640.1 hypothetical protein BABINDRAFT_162348 [Babjeviella inositovora NRRL Y-12698]
MHHRVQVFIAQKQNSRSRMACQTHSSILSGELSPTAISQLQILHRGVAMYLTSG